MVEAMSLCVFALVYLVVRKQAQGLFGKLPQPLKRSPRYRDKKRHAGTLTSYTSQAIAECNVAAANMRLQGEWSAGGVSPAMLAIAAGSSKGISLEILSLPAGRGWRYISAYRFGQTIGAVFPRLQTR
jgi:hypothetical protein